MTYAEQRARQQRALDRQKAAHEKFANRKLRVLTSGMLRDVGACSTGRQRFREMFPSGKMPLTRNNVYRLLANPATRGYLSWLAQQAPGMRELDSALEEKAARTVMPRPGAQSESQEENTYLPAEMAATLAVLRYYIL